MEGSTRSSMGTLSSWIVLRRGCWRRKRGIEGDAVVRCNVTSWSNVGNQQAIIFPPYHRFRRTRQEDEGTSLLQRGSILHNNPCDLKWNNHSLNQSPPEGGLMTCWNTNQPHFGTLSLICWKQTCFFGFRLFVCLRSGGSLWPHFSVVRRRGASVRSVGWISLYFFGRLLELSLWFLRSVEALFILSVGCWSSLYYCFFLSVASRTTQCCYPFARLLYSCRNCTVKMPRTWQKERKKVLFVFLFHINVCLSISLTVE